MFRRSKMTRTLKKLFLVAGLLLSGFLAAPLCIAQEHTSVQVDPVNGIATVSIEEDLRGRFTSAEFRTINIFGDDSENGQWQDIQVANDSFSLRGPGHYEISFRNPTIPFRTEIWRQRIYVPFGSPPVAAE